MAHAEINKDFLVAIYGDEDDVKEAVHTVRDAGVKIHEVFTPYPVHGLEKALAYPHSWTSKAAFMFGALGTTLALLMQGLMLGYDWPIIIGGKPFVSIPDFIPVTFEMTVLLAAFGMVGSFFVSEGLVPHRIPRIFDRRSTDDKMVMAIDLATNKMDVEAITNVLKATAVEETYLKSFTDQENKPNFIRYVLDLFTNGVTSSSRFPNPR